VQAIGQLLSLNVGLARPVGVRHELTGIDKRPVSGARRVFAPGPEGGGSGLEGDIIVDTRHHGGDDQALYAYARDDLDWWETELGRRLSPGCFGENLTTTGIDVTNAHIGDRWHIGEMAVVMVRVPRIPCGTFAAWQHEAHWVNRFTDRGAPGAYLKVLVPGPIQAGDLIRVEPRDGPGVTLEFVFRALTRQPELLPALAEIEDLPDDLRASAAAT
jgi:MOSC domain-containing protein YiiM